MSLLPRPCLRFVKRTERVAQTVAGEVLIGGGSVAKTVKVLQQFYEDPDGEEFFIASDVLGIVLRGAWRDVPEVEG